MLRISQCPCFCVKLEVNEKFGRGWRFLHLSTDCRESLRDSVLLWLPRLHIRVPGISQQPANPEPQQAQAQPPRHSTNTNTCISIRTCTSPTPPTPPPPPPPHTTHTTAPHTTPPHTTPHHPTPPLLDDERSAAEARQRQRSPPQTLIR
jgi:hypothetical protein